MLNFDYETSLLLLNTLFLENIVEKLGQGFDLFLVEIENLFTPFDSYIAQPIHWFTE